MDFVWFVVCTHVNIYLVVGCGATSMIGSLGLVDVSKSYIVYGSIFRR